MGEVTGELGPGRLRRFKRYPAYKDSGVEWLGEIPAHWEVTRTKFAARLRSGHTPSRQHAEYWANCTIPWFALADIWQIRDGQKEYVNETNEKISELGLANSAARLLPKGTVILSRTASVGFSAILGVDMATTQDFVNWVCGPRLLPEYLLYVFRSMQHEFRRLIMGSTHQTIYMPDVGGFCIPIPPISEQDRTVAFVREHTRHIDALVAKKKRLIELLREKRTALITRAVTKGLDPNVPMKDSGVEWLGEIPAHWEVKRLKYLVAEPLRYGANEAAELIDPELPRYIRITDIRDDGSLRDDTFRSIPEEVAAPHLLAEGDLLFARSGATVGKTFRYEPSWGRAGHAGYLIRARLDKRHVNSQFVLYFTQSQPYWGWLLSSFIQATIQNVSAERYASLVIPIPPPEEQEIIVRRVKVALVQLEGFVAKIRDAIDRLRELRAGLISAAVTGKIDVRDEAAA